MEKIRIGFIGCGWIADWACAGFSEIENAEASAVLARNKERMSAFCKKYAIPFYTDSMEEFLRKENGTGVHLDAVYVATTNETHYSMAKKAIEAGFPVFVEKPICMSGAQAREMKRLAEEKGVLIMEGMWTRFLPAAMLLKEKLKNGEIGKIKRIETAIFCKMNPVDNARVFRMETGGGALGNAEAARLSGINVSLMRWGIYVVMGIYVGVAAMVLTARSASAQVSAGQNTEMDAIAAVVMGGTPMSGGSANVIGTLFGCMIVGVINNGLNLMGVDSNWQLVAKGLMILLAITLDVISTKVTRNMSKKKMA